LPVTARAGTKRADFGAIAIIQPYRRLNAMLTCRGFVCVVVFRMKGFVGMLLSIYRQRRRIVTCAALFTLSALISSGGDQSGLGHLHVWVFPTSLAIMFAVIAFCLALLIWLLPALRSLWEVLALFTLFEAIMIRLAPDLNAMLDDTTLRLTAAAGIIALIHLALYGRLLDRVPALFSFGARSQVTINARPHQVWNAVVPQQATKAHFWGGKHYDVIPDPDEGDTVHLRCAVAPGRYESQSVTFVERERPYRCRYYFMTEDGALPEDLSEGIYDFKITPKGARTRLDMSLFRTGTRLREMLSMWFDDALGLQIDSLKARLEGKPRPREWVSWLTRRDTA